MDLLSKDLNTYAEQLHLYLEFHLFNIVYNALKEKKFSEEFYNLLINEKNTQYNKDVLEIYQGTALLIKKYTRNPLSSDEKEKADHFAKTVIGRKIVDNL